MTYDDWVKYKVATGLVHSEQLQAKLLKKLTDPKYKWANLKKEIEEEHATDKVTNAIDRQMQTSQINQLRIKNKSPQTVQTITKGNNDQVNYNLEFRFNLAKDCQQWGRHGQRRAPKPCNQCGFVPFFKCNAHFQPRPQQPQPFQIRGRPFRERLQIVREAEGNENDDAEYNNTLNMIAVRPNPDPLDPDAMPTTAVTEYDRDEHGNPIMPNARQTPLLYTFIREDKRIIHNPFSNPKTYRQVNTPITEVLCLVDSGCVQSVCHPNMAKACGLKIDHTDNLTSQECMPEMEAA